MEAVEKKEREIEVIRGSGNILLMDDEEFILDVTGEVLRTIGYQVEVARDGDETIEKYKSAMDHGRPFDLVIMDLTIPGGMGGKDAIKELLLIDPNIKAIVSSGYSKDATMSEYNRYGFKGVIPKPYKIEDLSKTVSDVITGHR